MGAYGGAFRFYQRAENSHCAKRGRITLYDHPHNDWLERCAELGFVGLGLFLIPGIFWIVRLPFASEPRVRLRALDLYRFAAECSFSHWATWSFVSRAVAASFALLLPIALRCGDALNSTAK